MPRARKIAAAAIAVTATAALGGTALAAGGTVPLGPASHGGQRVYTGFYDGHHDRYIVTDVSNKTQAAAMHINYSPPLAAVRGAPNQYFVEGAAARGQLAVFGSEPGEADYNPLWEEIIVRWKRGVKPVLLLQDDQINALAKKKELTLADAHVVLNAPIIAVSK